MYLVTVQTTVTLCFSILTIAAHGYQASEPPFLASIVAEIDRLSTLPSLINASDLLAGVSPAALAAFFASSINTNNSQPSPIARTFPNLTTGTINSSTVVLPIPFKIARSIVPSKYAILKKSIKTVVPFFPQDSYPVQYSQWKTWSLLMHRVSSLFRHRSTMIYKQKASVSQTSV